MKKSAEELGIEASETTIRRTLRKFGFRRCVAWPKPLISWINRSKRLKWARDHLNWAREDWLRVIFSDESTFETRKRARQFVIRRFGEPYRPECLNNFKQAIQHLLTAAKGVRIDDSGSSVSRIRQCESCALANAHKVISRSNENV
jgi:hypothetical protein